MMGLKTTQIITLLMLLVFIKSIPFNLERKLGNGIYHVGVNDQDITLFEGQYPVKNGMAYNSYAVMDGDEIAIFDTVDKKHKKEWLMHIKTAIGDKVPKYLIIQHMEPDHSANIDNFMNEYPDTKIVSSKKAFVMMKNFFKTDYEDRRIIVKEGDTLSLGKHLFTFVEAPMVHWPEVIVTYDSYTKTLFSADAFGKFGTSTTNEPWEDEARRYFIGIVGKFGEQVQKLLSKAANLDIQMICPTHGVVLTDNLGYYINKYLIWSSYEPEEKGVVIAYTSVYGNTKEAVELLAGKLVTKGVPKVVAYDLTKVHVSYAVADAFRYSNLILASTTYNGEVFPQMSEFILHLKDRNFQKRTVHFMQAGSWYPNAYTAMVNLWNGSSVQFGNKKVTFKGAVKEDTKKDIEEMAINVASYFMF